MRPTHTLRQFSLAAVALFSTPGAHALSIMEIQGAGHFSAFHNQAVTGVEGIVTALSATGFYIQDALGDADAATSDAIFVFTGASSPKPAVGDGVRVAGTVFEYRPGCSSGGNNLSCSSSNSAWNNLSTTEIKNDDNIARLSWSRVSSGNALPTAVTIGNGFAAPSAISASLGGSIENNPSYHFDPLTHAIDFYESLEGMRVSVSGASAVGATRQYSVGSSAENHELAVMADYRTGAPLANARGGATIGPDNFNGQRVLLSSNLIGTAAMPQARVGDTLANVTGVMDYSFANYKLQLTEAPVLANGGLVREQASPARAGQLSVASFNVENLAGNADTAKFNGLAGQIVTNLKAPDILALQEVQDNDGATNSGSTDASQTWGRLIDAIAGSGGPTYAYAQIDPVNNMDGGQPGANIRVGFLYNPAVVSFESMSRVDAGNPAWNDSRKPLAAVFSVNGEQITIIDNHFNSKGGDDPLFGRIQAPQLDSELQRIAQADVVGEHVAGLLAADPQARVVVLGDLNDFQFSAPLARLEAAGLSNLTDTLAEAERYTYIYEGNAQALDHILVSGALAAGAQYQVVHINSEFTAAEQFSDHDPVLARLTISPVPEADTWAMMLAGLGLIAAGRRRRS